MSNRAHLDGNSVIDRFACIFAKPAPHAAVSSNDHPQRGEVHCERSSRALRDTGVAPLISRATSLRDDSYPHLDQVQAFGKHERVSRAGGHAGKRLAEVTWNLVRKENRRAISNIERNTFIGTRFHAVPTSRASLEKQRFLHGSGRAQPIRSRGRRLLFRSRITVLDEFLRGLRKGDQGIFQKATTSVVWFSGHLRPTSRPRRAIYRPRRSDRTLRIRCPIQDDFLG